MHSYLHIFSLFTLFNVIYSFYLPGLAPVNYCKKKEESETCKVRTSFEIAIVWTDDVCPNAFTE